MFSSLLSSMPYPKRKIFTSYHHKLDQVYYDWLSNHLSDRLELFADRAPGEAVRSDDHEYVAHRIREEHIVGSSLTIVLCGTETHKRKYVDWEIHSTLLHKKALLGIILPTCSQTSNGNLIVPDRFYQNTQSGYAHYIMWNHQQWSSNPSVFISHIEASIQKSNNRSLIKSSDPKMGINRA